MAAIEVHRDGLTTAAERSIRHEFDLLGSGPVRVAHGMTASGLVGIAFPVNPAPTIDQDGAWLGSRINDANLPETRRIWRLVDPGYTPIDWQLDFKSGFRWSERTWYRDIAYGGVPGADVKVPWELARLQHLPQLALAAAKNGVDADRTRLVREIRNEVLDFAATNPPRFGVNWAVTMDVAIRAANLIVTRDLLAAAGLALDDAADQVLRRTVLEHGTHIAGNLEWDPHLRGNHYLAGLVGLVFAAAASAGLPEGQAWLELGARELVAELYLQFNEDGTCFEGSTSYHRLSSELAIYGWSVLLGSGHAPADQIDAIATRIAAMAQFTRWVTGPDQSVAQIGDNDSGRLFKLAPREAERSLDHGHLAGASRGLAGAPAGQPTEPPTVDELVVRALSGGKSVAFAASPPPARVGSGADLARMREQIAALPDMARATYIIPSPGQDLCAGLELAAFPDGGYWIARSSALQLVVRCGPVGQHGNGGHDHDDQLSFDLWLGDEHLIADPGTYVYTPLPDARNRYRSAANHSGPRAAGRETVGLDAPFSLEGARGGQCIYWGDEGFAGTRRDPLGHVALACISWFDDRLEIDHGIVGDDLHVSRRSTDWHVLQAEAPFSPGYGMIAG